MRYLLALLLATPALGQETVLTFLITGMGNGVPLPQDYGDRVTAATMGTYDYGGSGTFTPNVLVSHGGPTEGLDHWVNGYNDLLDVALNDVDGEAYLRLALQADAGYRVSLHGFDIGNWGGAITLPAIRVRDEHGLVYEELNVPLEQKSSTNEHNAVFAPPLQGQVLVIELDLTGLGGQSDNVGIDNVWFRQDAATSLGTSYCGPAVPNSSGDPATMLALGSAVVADNEFALLATGLARWQFGYFLASQTQAFVSNPGGSQGNLCLGGAITRFRAFVASTGPEALLALPLDLGNLPPPAGQILPGETWNFTCWFRDANPGATSNFADGVSVSFL